MKEKYLTKDEELALFQVIKTGSTEEAERAERVLFDNLYYFVKSMVGKYKVVGVVDYDDMLQVGLMGLLTAIRKFDPSKGVRLITYAQWWIRQTIERELLQGSFTIRHPTNHGYEGHKLQKMMHLGTVVPIGNRGELTTLEQSLVDESIPDITSLDDGVDRARLMSAVSKLKPNQRYVILERFGLNESRERMTLEQIGRAMNVTKQMVKYIQDCALKKLRSTIQVQ